MNIHGAYLRADQKTELEITVGERFYHLPNIWRVAKTVDELCPTLERSILRATGRAAALLLHLALSESMLAEIQRCGNRSRIGLYGASTSATMNFEIANQLSGVGTDVIAAEFSRIFGPKDVFRYGGAYVMAHTGMQLQLTGPVHNFNHAAYGALHAFRQAARDFNNDVIDFAVVAAVLSLEDPFDITGFENLQLELRESAAILLFDRSAMKPLLEQVEKCSPCLGPYQMVTPLLKILTE
jgi:hypothetical protein